MPIHTRYMVQGLRIEPKVGPPIKIALSYPVNLVMTNGAIYLGGIYAQPTAITSTLDGSPTVIDIGSVYDVDTITRDQIQSGYWDGARVHSFFTQWHTPIEDELSDRLYTMGKVREEDDRYTVELMGHLDLLNQSSGVIMTPGCRYVLGDAHVDGTTIATDKSKCKVGSLVANIPSSITSIVSPIQFLGAGLEAYPDDWFGYGELMFTSGQNAGLHFKYVTSFTGGAVIELAQPFYYPIEVGDTFDIRAGCRKRFTNDCIGKFSNAVHFGGYPDVPQKSSVIKFGDQ
jgi:uncharacterized phage protein (TIGR02218 family)